MNSSFKYPAPFRHSSYMPQILLPACVLASLIIPNFACAAAKTWIGSTSTDWATAANWNPGTAPVTADSLVFGVAGTQGASLTNTLTSGSFNVAGITFGPTASAYIFSGNSFNLTLGITNNSAASQAFNNTGGLTNSASSTFAVTAAGGVTITNGLTNTGAAGLTTTVNGVGGTLGLGSFTLNSGATSAVTNTLAGTGNIAVAGSVTNGTAFNNALTITSTGTVTLSGNNTYSGLTTLNTATGRLVLSGDNTAATGGLSLTSGTLDLRSAKALGSTGTFTMGGTIVNGSGSALTLTNANPIVLTGAKLGAAGNVGGNGDINFGTGAVSYSGVFTQTLLGTGSTFRYDGVATHTATGANAVFNVNGVGNTLIFGNAITLASDGATGGRGTTFGGSADIKLLGTVQNNLAAPAVAGDLRYNGRGTLSLAGANTYTGQSLFSSGTVVLDYTSNAGTKISGLGTGGKLTLGGSAALNLNGGAITETVGSTLLDVGANSINRTGGSSGVVALGAITRNPGSTLALATGGIATTTSGAVNSTLKSATTGNVYGVIGGNDWAATATASGPIVGFSTVGSYSLNTGATFASGANNDIVTDTTLAAAGNVATLRFNVASARTLDLNANQLTVTAGGILVTSAVGNNVTAINGGTLTAGTTNKELLFFQNNTANGLTVSSTITDNGANSVVLTKSGAGLLTLSNASNSYTGSTYLNQGTLSIVAEGSLGVTPTSVVAAQLVMSGGTLLFNGSNIALSANRGITLAGGGNTLDTNGQNASIAGIIGGAGSLTKTGAGTLTLTGTNSFTGPLTISGGIVNATTFAGVNASSSFGRGGVGDPADLVLDGGLLQYTGATAVTTARQYTLTNNGGGFDASGSAAGAMTLSGAMTSSGTTGAQALTLTGTGAATAGGTIGGVISNGNGTNVTSVNKTGTGTWTLSAANTYTGSTNISSGTLALSSAGSIGSSSSIVVSSGATFDVSAVSGYSLGIGQTLRGAGSVTGAVIAGSGRTIAAGIDGNTTGTLTFSSTLNVTAATVSLKLNSSTGVADLIASNGLTLGGATLALVDIGSGTWSGGSTFVIFNNTSGASVSGTFAGLAEGSTVNVGSNVFTISYVGGVGANDITLTASAVPEPSTYAAIFGGVALLGALYRRRAKSVV